MQYGMPRNFRAPRPREDNKGGPTKKKFGIKKFGLRLTHPRPMWRHAPLSWTQWYKKEEGRDAAYIHYKYKPHWLHPDKLEFEKVEMIER